MSSGKDLKRLDFDESGYIEQERLMEILIQSGIFTPEQNINPELMTNPEMIIQKFNQMFYQAANQMGVNFNVFSTDLFSFYISLKNESDRGCALIVASFLEKQLEEMLIEYLVDDTKVTKEFLKGTGGLASFDAKIDIVYLFGLIPPVIRRDLHILRRIRNTFAHNPEIINFTNDSIKDKCFELKFNSMDDTLTPRGRFVRVGISLGGAISGIRLNLKRIEKMEDPNYKDVDVCEFIDEMFESLKKVANQEKLD